MFQMCTPLLLAALGVSALGFDFSPPESFDFGESGNGGLSFLPWCSRLWVSLVPESFCATSLGVAPFFRLLLPAESDLDLGEAFGLSFFGDSAVEGLQWYKLVQNEDVPKPTRLTLVFIQKYLSVIQRYFSMFANMFYCLSLETEQWILILCKSIKKDIYHRQHSPTLDG